MISFSLYLLEILRNLACCTKFLQIVIFKKCRHFYRNVLNILTVLLHQKIIKTYCKKSCKTRTVIILLLSLFFLLYCSFYRIKDIVVKKNNGNEKRDMENNYEPCLYSRFAAKYWILTLVHALALRKLNFMTQGP